MAQDLWVPLRRSLLDDPRVLSLQAKLKCSKRAAIGAIAILWLYGRQHAKFDGDDAVIEHADAAMIDTLCGEGFTDAAVTVGWVEQENGHIRLPGFAKHNPQIQSRMRVQRHRLANSSAKNYDEIAEAEKPTPAPTVRHDWKGIADQWNSKASEVGLSPLRAALSGRRQAMFKARLRDHGNSFWVKVLDELDKLNTFALGDNEKGWKVDFEYAVSPKGCEKILDGGWRKDKEDDGVGKIPDLEDLL